MRFTFLRFWLAAMCLALPFGAAALQESKPSSTDARVRTFSYQPSEVYSLTGHYRYQTSVEFAPDEKIVNISIGDSLAWSIVDGGSRIFMKPLEQDATTNMTVITDKRVYLFELHAEEAEDASDDSMVFTVRFIYPEGTGSASGSGGGGGTLLMQFPEEEAQLPDYMGEPEKFNFNYTVTGSRLIAPLKVFDDGEFTYLQFRDKNGDVPAIFAVDAFGKESLINYRKTADFIVIERVSQQFTLRHGIDVACLFNESDPLQRKEDKSEKKYYLF